MADKRDPWCCWPGCPNDAEWDIRHGSESTQACTGHVGELLTDAPEHRIYRLPRPDVVGATD